MASVAELHAELQRLHNTGFDNMLTQAATANNFAAAFFFAIASRETNCVNELGDFQNGAAHGVGIVQIDIQHPIALQARDSGSWQTNPSPLIAFGAGLLAENIRQAQKAFPNLPLPLQLKIAASGYNCGITRAIAGAQAGDSDLHTTGHNYGADVITRMGIFQQLMAPLVAGARAGGGNPGL